MKLITVITSVLVLQAHGAVLDSSPRSACQSAVSLDALTNVWKNYSLHPNSDYRTKVHAAVSAVTDADLKEKAAKVADVGTFVWISSTTDISKIEPAVGDVPCNQILGLVLRNLPIRDCSVPTSDLPTRESYQIDFVDPITKIIKLHPTTAFSLILEPGSFPSVVLNANSSCHTSYHKNVAYALQTLNLPNVIIHLDVGDGGSLGWKETLKPAAREMAKVWEEAGKPQQLRGFATNVANYNSWDLSPGEFAGHPDEPGPSQNPAQNELTYVRLLSTALEALGAPHHAIVDTSRSAVQGLRYEWGHTCNLDGAGFGIKPSANSKEARADAFVWAKQGGVSDGTSDSTRRDYNSLCGVTEAVKPMPAEGEWSQAYFEMLVRNGKPQL